MTATNMNNRRKKKEPEWVDSVLTSELVKTGVDSFSTFVSDFVALVSCSLAFSFF